MSVQIILKNSSVEDKRPTANQLANGEVSLNYDEAGAFLCCRDDAGNIQQVGGIKISDDAPGTPVKGTLWLQPSTSTLFVHNGTSWLSIAGGGGGGGGVAGVSQIIGADGIDIAPASGTGIVSVNADINTERGLEFVAGEIAVNLGTGLSFNSNTGAIDADNQALTYKGTVDLTASAAAPASPALGDTYANTGDGAFDAVWVTATGEAAGTDADPGDLVAWNGTKWTFIPTGSSGGGGGGITNLTYTPTVGGTASQGGTVVSDTGTDADIPMVGHTDAGVLGGAAQAGLMHPDDKALIDQLPTDASGNLEIGTVTGITPGAGLRNDAIAGLNATAITTSGTISIGLTAASGLELDPAGTSGGLQVDLQAAGAGTGGLELSGNEIKVNPAPGIELNADGVGADLEAAGAGTGGLVFNGNEIRVDTGNGIELTADGVAADLEAAGAGTGGLEFDNGEIRVLAGDGIELTATGVAVDLAAGGGLEISGGELQVNTGTLDTRYVNISGDTMTGDLTVPSLNGGQLSGFRNQIINGDFRIWARGTSISLLNSADPADPGAYTSDRWFGGSKLDRVAIAYSGVGGFAQEANITPGTALGGITQGIELSQNGHPSQFTPGSTWTLSFYSNRSTNNAAGAFCDSVNNFSTGTATEIFSGTPALVPGETQRYSLTFTIPDPLTIDSTNLCFAVRISAGTGDQIRLTGVQLEPGSVSTVFEHRPIGTELALCQRYYQRVNMNGALFQGDTDGANAVIPVPLVCDMRTNATVTEVGTNSNIVTYNRGTYSSAASAQTKTIQSVHSTSGTHQIRINRDGGGSGSLCVVGANSSTGRAGTFNFDAEL